MTGNSIDVNLINPFIKSVVEVFTKMARMDVERSGLKIKNGAKMYGDLSAVIGLAGSGSGTAIISMKTGLAKTVVANMLYMNPEELNPEELEDGVGELINMIAGATKNSFSDTPYSFDISLPNVIKGKAGEYEIFHKKEISCFELSFRCGDEEFRLEISLKSNV